MQPGLAGQLSMLKPGLRVFIGMVGEDTGSFLFKWAEKMCKASPIPLLLKKASSVAPWMSPVMPVVFCLEALPSEGMDSAFDRLLSPQRSFSDEG